MFIWRFCMTITEIQCTARNAQVLASLLQACFFGVIKLNQDAFVWLRPDDNKSAASFQQAWYKSIRTTFYPEAQYKLPKQNAASLPVSIGIKSDSH